MDKKSAEIATICECIDHCFAFVMWCEDFAKLVDPDDMVAGLDRAFEIVSDSTRLQSFLALRKLDDFLGGVKPKPSDLVAADCHRMIHRSADPSDLNLFRAILPSAKA